MSPEPKFCGQGKLPDRNQRGSGSSRLPGLRKMSVVAVTLTS